MVSLQFFTHGNIISCACYSKPHRRPHWVNLPLCSVVYTGRHSMTFNGKRWCEPLDTYVVKLYWCTSSIIKSDLHTNKSNSICISPCNYMYIETNVGKPLNMQYPLVIMLFVACRIKWSNQEPNWPTHWTCVIHAIYEDSSFQLPW